MNFRKANNKDCNTAKSIIFSVLNTYGLQIDEGETDADLSDIERHYEGGWFGMVEDEKGQSVGTFGLYKLDKETAEIRKMYLLPEARAKGLGKRMLTFLLKKAREKGYKRVVLETASPLKEAIGLYQKFGFTEYFPSHVADRCDKAFEMLLD